jgi:hypothetical protein
LAELKSGDLRRILTRAHLGSPACLEDLRGRLTGTTFRAAIDSLLIVVISQLTAAGGIGLIDGLPALEQVLIQDDAWDKQLLEHWLLAVLAAREQFAVAAIRHFVAAMDPPEAPSRWFAKSLLRCATSWERKHRRFAAAVTTTARLLGVPEFSTSAVSRI